eukprot:10874128-Alexandrium_andersonii.AAC.1
MSASLVGSEMCIRDRTCADRRGILSNPARALRAAPLSNDGVRRHKDSVQTRAVCRKIPRAVQGVAPCDDRRQKRR